MKTEKKRRRWPWIALFVLVSLAAGVFFGGPPMAAVLAKNAIGLPVKGVSLSWWGPQHIDGISLASDSASAELDVRIDNGLIPILLRDRTLHVFVGGNVNATMATTTTTPVATVGSSSTDARAPRDDFNLHGVPPVSVTLDLRSAVINDPDGGRSINLQQVSGSFDYDPGRHVTAFIRAATTDGGYLEIDASAPNLFDSQGMMRRDAAVTADIVAASFPLPRVEDWIVRNLTAKISSPGLEQTASLLLEGTLSEKGVARGRLLAKLQIDRPIRNGAFTLDPASLIGHAEIKDVPTAPIAPLVQLVDIDLVDDIGPMVALRLERTIATDPLNASLSAEHVSGSARVLVDDSGNVERIEQLQVEADIRPALLRRFTDDVLDGDVAATVRIGSFVPSGNHAILEGEVEVEGPLQIALDERQVTIDGGSFTVLGSVEDRQVLVQGDLSADGRVVPLELNLGVKSSASLDGLDDLWKQAVEPLPQGIGTLELTQIPSALLQPWLADSPLQRARDIGDFIDLTMDVRGDAIETTLAADRMTADCLIQLQDGEVVSLEEVTATVKVAPALLSDITGLQIKQSSTATISSPRIDMDATDHIDATLSIVGPLIVATKRATEFATLASLDCTLLGSLAGDGLVFQGHVATDGTSASVNGTVTTTGTGSVDATVTIESGSTSTLDTLANLEGLLVDAIGQRLDANIALQHLESDAITCIAEAASTNGTIQSSFIIEKESIRTQEKSQTMAELRLTPQLTSQLLRNLGPVLADIRSINHPIYATIRNASIPTNGDLAQLNADISLDIGSVTLDSGSATMRLLTLFNSSHAASVPAFVETIELRIRKGIVMYDTFRIVIDDKYTMPFGGRINLITHELRIASVAPLQGLGYSIKELRGLAKDIEVPLLIRGTIENPTVSVDPSFDLAKLLQDSAVNAIGDAISGSGKGIPDPMDLIEELLKGR
jgi:hypothetical protein